MEYLIDPQGNWSRWPSENLAEQLGYPNADFDLAGYAARNLGYVWLLVQPSYTFVQFRAGHLAPNVAKDLASYLEKAVRKAPVALVYYSSGWMEEIFLEPGTITARLSALAELSEPRMRDKFLRASHELETWDAHGEKPLVHLYELWRANGAHYNAQVQEFLQRTGLVNRTLMVEDRKDIGLSLRASGDGFSIYDDFKLKQMIGRRLTDQPDAEYGRWTALSYSECMQSGRPLADDIDAIIEADGHDLRRRRYQRLILRWFDDDGAIFLTGSSLISPYISLPLGNGDQFSG